MNTSRQLPEGNNYDQENRYMNCRRGSGHPDELGNRMEIRMVERVKSIEDQCNPYDG